MPLEFRRQRDGSYRDTWFGAFAADGKRYSVNLGIKIAGVPPASRSLRDKGDEDYELSRGRALQKLAQLVEEARSKRNSAQLIEKLYEIKTGEQMRSVTLESLGDEWAKIPRRHAPNARYAAQCQATLKRFADFIKEKESRAEELAQVTRELARSFMDEEGKRGVTAKTWNETLKLLRATCKHLLPAGAINPFSDMPTRDVETVFRIPYSPEELAAISAAAKEDEFIRPILVVGMCTAMRRGDCCLLKWQDVDLQGRFITVKTAKTGQTVSIPIFPMLYEELQRAAKAHRGAAPRKSGYVFPEQARMYLENADGITWRVKKVLATALGADALEPGEDKLLTLDGAEASEQEPVDGEQAPEVKSKALEVVSDEEARRRGVACIGNLANPKKRERMATVFDFYMGGKKLCEAAAAAGVSKGSVSGYLNEIEAMAGCKIVRGRHDGGGVTLSVKSDRTLLRTKREGGQRMASIRDFHSFRVTWVTIALTGGVPLELVQKVTGHKTTDVVLKHYFQPGREAFRKALQEAMPRLLTNGQKTPKEQAVDIAEQMTAKTWKKDREQILELLKKM